MGSAPPGHKPPHADASRSLDAPGLQREGGVGLVELLGTFAPPGTWTRSTNLVVSLVVGGLFASLTACALVASLATAWIVGVGVLVRAGTLRLATQMARVDRRRLGRLGAAHIEPLPLPAPEPGASFTRRQLVWARAPWLWRIPVYQLARLPLAAATAFAGVGWWWATVVCFVLAAQPSGPILLIAWNVGPVSLGAGEMALLVLAGVVGLLAWPFLVRSALTLEVVLARELLGPSPRRWLAVEVARLSEARTLAVESAQAERRRIERDLHDGLQPQLVSLALDLGLARAHLDRDPESARSMVEHAHEEAKRAAEDLRNLVRGIHPSVLDERGLDAALSALIANCPVPVSIEVSLPSRPGPTPESVAYFVVAEAITNVTKHAQAHRASVTIDGDGASLHVLVEDDGQGRARLEPGGGLVGLAARVGSIDGRFSLESPPGGPTRIEAVIPCGP